MPSLGDTEEINILICANDAETRSYIKDVLQGEGHKIFISKNTSLLVDESSQNPTDLIILDFDNVGAIDACKTIRNSFVSRHIPIILMVTREHTIEKIKGIYSGADDYIEKPINAGELLTRIQANVWRAKRDLDANPLTKLPGNVTILKELENRIKGNKTICVSYADLDKFKEYNDYYGFEWGDKVIKHTAQIISRTLLDLGSQDDFLGHIGGDDFIFVCDWESITTICERITSDFDKTIGSFYKDEDRERGYIVVKDRRGNITATSILTISVGVATNKNHPFHHIGEIIQIASELKNYAKTFAKSIYIIDRRKG